MSAQYSAWPRVDQCALVPNKRTSDCLEASRAWKMEHAHWPDSGHMTTAPEGGGATVQQRGSAGGAVLTYHLSLGSAAMACLPATYKLRIIFTFFKGFN